jgi:hypothetical protein
LNKLFELKMKFEGRTLVKKQGNNISDFDPIIDTLKQKFDGPKKERRS